MATQGQDIISGVGSLALPAVANQTSLGTNILTGTTEWLDLNNIPAAVGNGVQYRDILAELQGNTVNTAGSVIWEGSLDGITPVPLRFENNGVVVAAGSFAVASATTYQCKVLNKGFRYIRGRISVPFTGSTPGVSVPFIYAVPDNLSNPETVLIASDQAALPIRLGVTDYVQTTGNNTSTQLAASAIWAGAYESALNYPQIVLSVRCDTTYTIYIQQFSDAAGTISVAPDIVYTRDAGVGFSQAINIAGNYFRVQIQNTNTTTATTQLFVETWLGLLPPLPNLDNRGAMPVSFPKKILINGVSYGTTDNAAIPNALNAVKFDSTPTDVSEFGGMLLSVSAANTGRDFTLTGGWAVSTANNQNLPLLDIGSPLNPPLFGAQPTTTTFNKSYYVDLTGINFIQLSVLAAAQLFRARVVCYTFPIGYRSGAQNLSQIGGIAPAVNSGAVNTGTLRTVQAQLTTTFAGAVPQTASDYSLGATARIRKLKFLNENAVVMYVGIYSSAAALTAASIPLNGLVWRVPANADLVLSVGDFGETGTFYGATTRIGISSTRNTYTALTAPQLAASALHLETV